MLVFKGKQRRGDRETCLVLTRAYKDSLLAVKSIVITCNQLVQG